MTRKEVLMKLPLEFKGINTRELTIRLCVNVNDEISLDERNLEPLYNNIIAKVLHSNVFWHTDGLPNRFWIDLYNTVNSKNYNADI